MLSKAHLTSHSRKSGSSWVITPSWLSGSWRSFWYSSSVYSCHLYLISSASVRSIPKSNSAANIKPVQQQIGTPFHYSCLENPMDDGAWWAVVHGVTKSRTWLSDFTFTIHFHALEKEMPRKWYGPNRSRHDWSNLSAAAAVKAMVFPVVTYGCQSWTIKKTECQRIYAFELWFGRRLSRVLWTARRFNPKGNQSWIFFGKTDAKAKTPTLWPPDVKNWLIRKDPDAGKDWRQEEKGMTEDEMIGWNHWLNRHEFE